MAKFRCTVRWNDSMLFRSTGVALFKCIHCIMILRMESSYFLFKYVEVIINIFSKSGKSYRYIKDFLIRPHKIMGSGEGVGGA